MKIKYVLSLHFFIACFWAFSSWASEDLSLIDSQIALHPNQSGIYVLDKGEAALLARAWLADHAEKSIEVQYFIWSTDNIGILASEALLRAAERGVKVRVIVDDLLVDAPDKSLLALAKHPNIDIRIYNPQHKVGTPFHKRLLNIAVNFRGVNQRMHDKTFIVDGKLGITGGRNMADEYFDFNQTYNFRDRDALLIGNVVTPMQVSFNQFWASPLSAPVEELYDGLGIIQKNVTVNDTEIRQIYTDLHTYAKDSENFSMAVRKSIKNTPQAFNDIIKNLTWTNVEFISDTPGKNNNRLLLGGGGKTTKKLASLVENAQHSVVIQSPYLVMSSEAIKLFKRALKRGVQVKINTNSLASTDNLAAFGGYRNQRDKLIQMGIEIYEFKPNPDITKQLMRSETANQKTPPIFAIHAKTMVVDKHTVYIGTFNFDPRSENLNTEVGVIVQHAGLGKAVEKTILTDMQPGNSWNAATGNTDGFASVKKRLKVIKYQLMPIKPLL
jgi:putative cardiolipin synthase